MNKIQPLIYTLALFLSGSNAFAATPSCDVSMLGVQGIYCVDPKESTGGTFGPLSWRKGFPFPDRQNLQLSSDVSANSRNCDLFAQMMKTECGIPDPVTAIWTNGDSTNPLETIHLITEANPNLSKNTPDLPLAFQKYFSTTAAYTAAQLSECYGTFDSVLGCIGFTPCVYKGKEILPNASVIAYAVPSVPAGQYCTVLGSASAPWKAYAYPSAEVRCVNGVMVNMNSTVPGAYPYDTCVVLPAVGSKFAGVWNDVYNGDPHVYSYNGKINPASHVVALPKVPTSAISGACSASQTLGAFSEIIGDYLKCIGASDSPPAPVYPSAPLSPCQVTVSFCPNSPATLGTFTDNSIGASADPNACMQEAKKFYNWCGGGPTVSVQASFVTGGMVRQTVVVDWTSFNASGTAAALSIINNFLLGD